MIISMTGFGSATARTASSEFKVEVRTLNSKFLDISLRVPKVLAEREHEIRNLVGQILKRGKVSLSIEQVVLDAKELPTEVNEALFTRYLNRYQELATAHQLEPQDLFKLALHSPDVLQPPADIDSEQIWSELKPILAEAMTHCQSHRSDEGKALEKELRTYVQGIDQRLEQVASRDEHRQANIRARLDKSMSEIKEKIQMDPNRFEQELIYYLEKLDISEEKVRLKQHLNYFLEVMDQPDSQGKKLGFITQEIGREINTIGSKANDADIQKRVVEMKDELEKIKEQMLNVL